MTTELLKETPSQTAGPYVHIGMHQAAAGNPTRDQEISDVLAKPGADGEHIRIEGRVFDGNGNLIKDSFIEVWQANAQGEYDPVYNVEKPFNSFGRTATTFDQGVWTLDTVKPGAVAHPSGANMAPHINLSLFARGINIHLQTRLYFADEAELNAKCPVLNMIEHPSRRETLIAQRVEENGRVIYRFDIRVQGENETVFFDF
ncbi:protocatechuate 3,4-dioxygenase subunit alpha [Marinobacterium rhizophilum]|uniref:protocatechuate 3,4-dioxygenase subunit alpha n=1 Tax=Marinobacterium rhizophilum TaxID=420402 RepID=UPI000476F84C|nr:protocatechuate 3,4-dioxygenase subunit alpha [Marinobacterium rhizophilum]